MTNKEIMHKLSFNTKDRLKIFKKIPIKQQAFLLLELSKKIRFDILHELTDSEIVELIDYLDPDDASDILKILNGKRQKNILNQLKKEIKQKIEKLLSFDPRIAEDLVSLEYVEVDENIIFEKLLQVIKIHEKRTGKFPTILVLKKGNLRGELSPLIFLEKKKKQKITKYIKKVSTILYNTKNHKVVEIFKKNTHSKIVVLDKDKSILGIIYSDDILKIINEKPAESLRDFAGISDEEQVLDPALSKVKRRYRWLIINLGTAFLAASVVSLFQETITAFVLLAVYMPIIAGMGGNAGTQTLAVMVRGIALNKINLNTAKRVIINEFIAGGINGLITGVLVAIIATLWNQNPLLGLIVGMAMIINLMIAGFFGSIIPLIMTKLGKDPASSATIFITTATDVFGFFAFLGLATLFL